MVNKVVEGQKEITAESDRRRPHKHYCIMSNGNELINELELFMFVQLIRNKDGQKRIVMEA